MQSLLARIRSDGVAAEVSEIAPHGTHCLHGNLPLFRKKSNCRHVRQGQQASKHHLHNPNYLRNHSQRGASLVHMPHHHVPQPSNICISSHITLHVTDRQGLWERSHYNRKQSVTANQRLSTDIGTSASAVA